MIIKTRHGFFFIVGLLITVCLCCLVGIIVYLALSTNVNSTAGVKANKTLKVFSTTRAPNGSKLHITTITPTGAATNKPSEPPPQDDFIPEDTPTAGGDIEFEDTWDYKISPHRVPLLQNIHENHVLPPTASPRKSKSEDVAPRFASTGTSRSEKDAEKLGDSVRSKISCSTCKLGVGLLHAEVRKGTPFLAIKAKFVSICVTFKIQIESVCSGIFDVYGPDVLPALNTTEIGAPEICSIFVGETCGEVPNPLHEWNVSFPSAPKPAVHKPPPPKQDGPVFKVLHISDTHYDPQYQEGTVVNCQEPLCCRISSTPPENASTPIVLAGKWGSYEKCDAPKILIDNALNDIRKNHQDVDYIIWTGDLPPHDVWRQTKNESLEILVETLSQIYEAFPSVPIFPALGNHEAIPAGNYPPPWMHHPNHSVDWLYTEVAKEWKKWLPDTSKNTLLHGGFYSVLIRPGFRLISMNMNYCHTISWWLYVNSTDPARELQWLIYELQAAEDNAEKVHIIGHIPPGQSDCMKVWSRNYYSIINRYEDTITAQFYGHTHQDEFEVFYDTTTYRKPTSIAYIGPSITTFENNNPGYRIYYVDGDHNDTTREVIDHETWALDLEAANNATEVPVWYKLYSAKAAYGLQTLRPSEWSGLIERMVDDSELFDLFYKFYYRDSPARPQCDTNKCRLQILCDLKSGKSHDRHHLCHDLEVSLPD